MRKILLIEDEDDICKVVEFRLKKAGFDVIIAKDGKTGLVKAKEEKPDLIILDLMLPELSGEDVCREVRTDEHIGNMPIIMLTAKASEADRIVGKVIGADSYITEPFDPEELLKEIKRLIY